MEGRTLRFIHSLTGIDRRQSSAGNPTNLSSIHISPTLEIALIAGGGGLLLIVLIIVIVCVCRRRRKKRNLPVAATPTDQATFFNPNALPENPLPQRQPSDSASMAMTNNHYRQPSSQLAYQPSVGAAGMYSNYNYGGRSQTPAQGAPYGLPSGPSPYGGNISRSATPVGPFAYGNNISRTTTPVPAGEQYSTGGSADAALPQRRGTDTPAPLKINTRLRAPSGIGLERVKATAWGIRGRHVDQDGTYHGSIAQQGGANSNKDLPAPPVPGVPAMYQQQQSQDVYGDDDVYAARVEQMELMEQRQANATPQPGRYATPQPGRYAASQPDRYATPQPGRYNTPQPDRYATPQPPQKAISNPYRQELGHAYISPAGAPQGNAYQERYGGRRDGYEPVDPYGGYAHSRNGSEEQYGYNHSRSGSDERYVYGYGGYGHSRQASDEREAAPTGWL